MKTKANQIKLAQPQVARRICRSMALILVAFVLQGCATAKTAWLRHDKPERHPATMVEKNVTTRDSNPMAVLVRWNF